MYLYLFVVLLGLVLGSFISAYTYRIPRGISVKRGRSKCPKCKKPIIWYDNIPLLSYIFLKGKCRNCGKKISPRYAIIEASTAILFLLGYLLISNCSFTSNSPLCKLTQAYSVAGLPYLFLLTALAVIVFVTDWEHKIILDEAVFGILISAILYSILFKTSFYQDLFTGFLVSLGLLIVHFVTLGKGMGLGDVKLAIAIGVVLGWGHTLVWMLLSFIYGALAGLILILMKRTKFRSQIAFGPFMIISFFTVLFWGHKLKLIFLPL